MASQKSFLALALLFPLLASCNLNVNQNDSDSSIGKDKNKIYEISFVNYKFNIPSKMSYTVPSMYNLKSDKYLNSNTSSFKFDVDINTELAQKYELEKEKEALGIVLLIISELYEETLPKEQAIEMLLDYEKERRNEK